jgi:hypothetical protein
MFLTTFHPHQNEENLRRFIEKSKTEIVVLSHKPLQDISYGLVSFGNIPPQDEALNIFLSVLSSDQIKSENFTLIDWEIINSYSSLEAEISKLKMTEQGFEIIQENVTVQDFRLHPYLGNLLKICHDLKLSGVDRLFSENPLLILPKILRGEKVKLIEALGQFSVIRESFKNQNFCGCIPIFNSQFSIK